LPDETKRFEKVDTEWKDLMREANEEPGFIAACTSEGRDELLYTFNSEIEQCEKALNDYLEQKKKVFARFYFVSNQALLDILSNGNNPEVVNTYLTDCFDGMKDLDLLKDEGEPRPSRRAKGMFSKEGEYVSFGGDIFSMNGAVENYLCDVETQMKVALRKVLTIAKATADNWEIEKKRHDWLEDYCAQVSLVATQIMWTEEVGRVFEDIEGGAETAMKDYLAIIVFRLKFLIERVRGQLTSDLRVKIITIITIDVHERDVVDEFMVKKINEAGQFAWQRQLKFYWE
jgi:dynein heavy chain